MEHLFDRRTKANAFIPSKRIHKTEEENYNYIVSYYTRACEIYNLVVDGRHDELFHNLAKMSDDEYLGWMNSFKKIYSSCLNNNAEFINRLSQEPEKYSYLLSIEDMYKTKEQVINRSLPMSVNTVDIRVRSEKIRAAYSNYIDELSYDGSVLLEKMKNDLRNKYADINDPILNEYLDRLVKGIKKDALALAERQLYRMDYVMKSASYSEATSIGIELQDKRNRLANSVR